MAERPLNARIRPQSKEPFYEKNAFQGWAAFAVAALFTVIGMYAKPILAHVLLLLAWAAGSVAFWKAASWQFSVRSRSVPLTALGSVVYAIGLYALDSIIVVSPRTKPDITVTPGRLVFDGSLPRENLNVTIRNNMDSDAYSVQIKMKFSHNGEGEFYFAVPNAKRIIEGSRLDDVQGLKCVDNQQRPVVMFWIYRLQPGETRDISITHNLDTSVTVDSKLAYFTHDEVPRTGDPIHSTGTFHFDEPMTCNGDYTFQAPSSTPTPLPTPAKESDASKKSVSRKGSASKKKP